MNIKITAYNAVCNLGGSINEIYEKALKGDNRCFKYSPDFIKDSWIYLGAVTAALPEIFEEDYNTRCCRLILSALKNIEPEISEAVCRHGAENTGIITASSNSGVSEFEYSNNPKHYHLGAPAEFLRRYLKLSGYYTSVSAACSSGLKVFSLAADILNSGICSCIITVCSDPAAKVPVYGFNSLEVLSSAPSIPFSKNRTGMNIGEGAAVFILEKNAEKGIEIAGIGESTDITHMTAPDINAAAAQKALHQALKAAGISPCSTDYINAHGTGTIANDIMEARAINAVFGSNIPVSSTKPLTGHCLGAAAGIETALCCRLLDDFRGILIPHIYDGAYDEKLPKIKLVEKDEAYKQCRICLCSSFGFGGADAAIILKK